MEGTGIEVLAGSAGGLLMAVSITGDGIAIGLDGDAGITYDRKSKTLTVHGLGPSDRVTTRTDSRDQSQAVIVQFGAVKLG